MASSALHKMAEYHAFDAHQLREVEAVAELYTYAPVKAALNFGFLDRKTYETFLTREGFPFIDLNKEVIDEAWLSQCDLYHMNAFLYLPMRLNEFGELLVAVADPMDEKLASSLIVQFKCRVKLVAASDLDITWHTHTRCGRTAVKDAVFSLARKDPESSGHITFTDGQLAFIFSFMGLLLALSILYPLPTLGGINLVMSILFLTAIVFKLYLALSGSKSEMKEVVTREEIKRFNDAHLPVYSILLPVYKEDQLIRKLIWNMRGMDYPQSRLDVKLLVEEDDTLTFNALHNLDFPANFELIVVPYHLPKTKPKACNYGIPFCRGEFLTIYDAEDVPDPDQLKKTVCLFRKLPDEFVVVQGALNYFNKNENFLTRMFTLEYSYWFDYMLTGLEKLDVPIPLGGSSNHFKLAKLIELGAWDPFNVTEDADLGVRVYGKQFKVGVVNSTTFEEANNEPFNWIRQRSRWIKGYMQTYLVHMRNPAKLVRHIGWTGFFGFNLFIGGTAFTFLLYPLLILFFGLYLVFKFAFVRALFPDWVLYVSIFNFITGNVLMIYVNMLAVFKRRYYELIMFAVLNPIYWLMHSTAAYKGLWQLITNPFYWEKTTHGLSKLSSTSVVTHD